MASVLHDASVFSEAHRFDPDRYLIGDVNLCKQRTIPFGMGKSTYTRNTQPFFLSM